MDQQPKAQPQPQPQPKAKPETFLSKMMANQAENMEAEKPMQKEDDLSDVPFASVDSMFKDFDKIRKEE